jgi:hypothetical protein
MEPNSSVDDGRERTSYLLLQLLFFFAKKRSIRYDRADGSSERRESRCKSLAALQIGVGSFFTSRARKQRADKEALAVNKKLVYQSLSCFQAAAAAVPVLAGTRRGNVHGSSARRPTQTFR